MIGQRSTLSLLHDVYGINWPDLADMWRNLEIYIDQPKESQELFYTERPLWKKKRRRRRKWVVNRAM